MPSILCDDANTLRDVEHVHAHTTLACVIANALDAYHTIKRTWVRDSYVLSPWWIWREDDAGVLHFNLVGLVAYSYGWVIGPDTDTQHVRIAEVSRRNMRDVIGRRANHEEVLRKVAANIGIIREAPVHRFVDAIDAVRRGDYRLAMELYYHRRRVEPLGATSGPKVYILGDESARDPDFFIHRLHKDIPKLGAVDMSQVYRV